MRLSSEGIETRAGSHAGDQFVKLNRLARMLAATPIVADEKILGVSEDRCAFACIDDELSVVLRQVMRLKPAWLVPHHRQHVLVAKLLEQRDGIWQMLRGRPAKGVAIAFALRLDIGSPQI